MLAAIVDASGLVVNLALIGPDFLPDDGHQLVELDEAADHGAQVGGTWTEADGFAPAPVVEPIHVPFRVSKARFGDLFRREEHRVMNLLRWQIGQMDAADRMNVGNPLIDMEVLFQKFDLPAEFIELDHPLTVQAMGLFGLMGVFGAEAETRIEQVLANLDPPA